MSALKANALSIIIMLPLVFGVLYAFNHLAPAGRCMLRSPVFTALLYLAAMLAGFVVHELIHGATAALFAKQRFRAIRFGIMALTPYCHCNEPLRATHYRIVAIMPCIVLGIIPTLLAFFISSNFLVWFGVVMLLGAGGDILIILLSFKVPPHSWVKDHDSKIGFTVVENE